MARRRKERMEPRRDGKEREKALEKDPREVPCAAQVESVSVKGGRNTPEFLFSVLHTVCGSGEEKEGTVEGFGWGRVPLRA